MAEILERSRGYVTVEDRLGIGLPYSKGLMATSIMATGLPPERAFALAEAIERELLSSRRRKVTGDELAELAVRVLTALAGREVAERYRAWRRAKRAPKPTVVLIGGAPGVGKSTVATRLGARLGITRIIPTDAVRQVMRNVISHEVLPVIHDSMVEPASLGGPRNSDLDGVVSAFVRQAEAVVAGVKGLVARAIVEQVDIAVEGNHVVPGLLGYRAGWDPHRASVVEVLLVIEDPDAYRAQLIGRQEREHSADAERHLDRLPEILRIQDHLRGLAARYGVTELDASDLDRTIQALLDLVVAAATSGETEEVAVRA